MPGAFISGCAATALSGRERQFFRDADPLGFILFARNIETPQQVSALVQELRESVGRDDAPVLVDQEGGRVQRFRPPHWRAYPPAARLGALYASDPEEGLRTTRAVARLMAHELNLLGINVDCVPVLDVPQPGADDVIGDRAYGTDPATVATLGRIVAEAMLDSGVLPVIKHIPGHGRALCDSHKALPRVETELEALQQVDFAPFIALRDMPIAMTAHVVYTALDAAAPATQSANAVAFMREALGFEGLLLTDDLSMNALSGRMADRVGRSLAAGCDVVLHCNGNFAQMEAVASAAPRLDGTALRRTRDALARLARPKAFDVDEATGRLDRLLHESV